MNVCAICSLFEAVGLDGRNVFSGLLGALVGGLLAGRYMVWQTKELARNELRRIAVRFAVHMRECRGDNVQRTDPWTESGYKDDAIAAYLRYRSLLLPWKRKALDKAWKAFQGTDFFGDTPFAHVPMTDIMRSEKQVQTFINSIP